MSFLAGRLAATEGSYFLQESKHAVGRLAQKVPPPSSSKPSRAQIGAEEAESADILPEILRHSIPLKGTPPPEDPSISTASKWLLHQSSSSTSSISSNSLNPLRAYVSLPQVTFGAKRWQLPEVQPNVWASTANELRQDRYSQMDSKKLKALAVGYSQIATAFAISTMIVFGGATAIFAFMVHKLQMETTEDIKTKGKDLIQPRADLLREKMVPLRAWAENLSKKWHVEGGREVKEKSVLKEFSKVLGHRT